MKFSKILHRRRQGKGNESFAKTGPPLEDATDFHQLTSRRANGHAAMKKKAPRTGRSRIVIPDATTGQGHDTNDINGHSENNECEAVCEICSSIDFPKLLSWKPGDPRPWVPLTHTLKDKSMCPYCTFFQAMIGHVSTSDEAQNGNHDGTNGHNAVANDHTGTFTPFLRIRQAFERLGISQKHPLAKSVFFEVTTKSKTLPRGYIIRANSEDVAKDKADIKRPLSISGNVVAPLLDTKLVHHWLESCKGLPINQASDKSSETKSKTLQRRFIDCNKVELVTLQGSELSGAKYATFSYATGGEGENESKKNTDLPNELPPLFRDAVHLTKSLDIPYLWIDRYCAPSEQNATEWKDHAEQLGHVYEDSALSIIATGTDSLQDGIYGISVPRQDPLSLQIGNDVFTTSLVRPDIEIGTSKWSSQAWNLQAGLLSKRRVVLTPSQAYFQCGALHYVESLSIPKTESPSPNLGIVFPAANGDNLDDLRAVIAMYMNRNIAARGQRLDAFTGILKSFNRGPRSISSFLGLPLLHPDDLSSRRVVSQTDLLAASLGWMTTVKKTAVTSPNDDPDTRSNECTDPYILDTEYPFPSWTWLAWRPRVAAAIHSMSSAACPFQFNLALKTEKPLQGVCAPPGTEMSIGFEDNMVVSWEIDGEAISRRPKRIKFLRIRTFCFDVKVTRKEGSFALSEPTDILSDSSRAMIEETVRLACIDDPTSATDKEEFCLTGILTAGRNWQKQEPVAPLTNGTGKSSPAVKPVPDESNGDGAATVLLCANHGWADNGHLVRLGAMGISFTDLSWVSQNVATTGDLAELRGVGDKSEGTGELPIVMREVDLY